MPMSHEPILTVVGARPQFIKAAPVSAAMARAGLREILVHTGQHFDPQMSDVFFDELGLRPPDHHLQINSLGHGAMTGRMLEALERVMLEERPAKVLIYGDTNSTLAGALAAAKLNIPVAHVEAGLRSFNRRMPEEVNRVLADHVSTLLFCPTQTAVANLNAEGILRGVHLVGDVMYDATIAAVKRASERSNILDAQGLTKGSYAVATIHRAENTDDPERLTRILAWLEATAKDCQLVMPVHPRSRKLIEARHWSPKGVLLLPPVGYLDMTMLLAHAAAVYTDSGGLQKEAYFHRVPCVTLREETEWVETVKAGWNRLWTQPARDVVRHDIAEYGAGDAADRIVSLLKSPHDGG
jgi:UDP-GlcNAc3NAcA epimerase